MKKRSEKHEKPENLSGKTEFRKRKDLSKYQQVAAEKKARHVTGTLVDINGAPSLQVGRRVLQLLLTFWKISGVKNKNTAYGVFSSINYLLTSFLIDLMKNNAHRGGNCNPVLGQTAAQRG